MPLFVLAAATLFLEILLTRIFSIALWSHYSFLIVSLALLGFGASGVLLHLFPSLKRGRWIFLLLFFLSGVSVYVWISRLPFDPIRIAWDPWQLLWLSLSYGFASIPFLFSGLYLGSRFLEAPRKSLKIYGVNLVGSAVGSLLSLWLLNEIPLQAVRPSPYKPLSQALLFPDARLLETRWSAEARIDLFQSGAVRFAPGLSLNYGGDLPDQLGLTRDGDRLNAVTRLGRDPLKFAFFSYLPSAAPYFLLERPKALIVQAGGGSEIFEAFSNGAREVVALETNKKLVKLVDQDWKLFSGSPYSRSNVRWIPDHARRFLSHSTEDFDLIVLSLSDNPLAASTGLYGTQENYLFTLESFRSLIQHLQPTGILALTRFLLPPPREEPRTIVLAAAALESLGNNDPLGHLALIESYGTWTLLLKRTPFVEREREILDQFCTERGFQSIVPLLIPSDPLFDLSPPTDDRPFFFHFFQLSRLRETFQSLRGQWEAFLEGGYLIYAALAQALVWGTLLLLGPLFLRKIPQPKDRTWRFGTGLYFFSIGLAFMFVEMAFLQKAVFLLGNPTSGFAFLLASLLFFSGLGSLGGNAFPLLRDHPRVTTSLLALLVFFSLLPKNPLMGAVLGIPIFFLMGLPFPTMLARIERDRIPLAWAINGVASVVGAILAVLVALEWGYSRSLAAAGFLYLFCASPVIGTKRTSMRRS